MHFFALFVYQLRKVLAASPTQAPFAMPAPHMQHVALILCICLAPRSALLMHKDYGGSAKVLGGLCMLQPL